MNVSERDSIVRTPDFDSLASSLQLRPWEWDFLHVLDGERTVGEAARACGVEVEHARSFVEEATQRGIVSVVTMSLEQYRARGGAPLASAATLQTAPPDYDATPVAEPAWMLPSAQASPPVAAAVAPASILAPEAEAKPPAISLSSDTFDWNADLSAYEADADADGGIEHEHAHEAEPEPTTVHEQAYSYVLEPEPEHAHAATELEPEPEHAVAVAEPEPEHALAVVEPEPEHPFAAVETEPEHAFAAAEPEPEHAFAAAEPIAEPEPEYSAAEPHLAAADPEPASHHVGGHIAFEPRDEQPAPPVAPHDSAAKPDWWTSSVWNLPALQASDSGRGPDPDKEDVSDPDWRDIPVREMPSIGHETREEALGEPPPTFVTDDEHEAPAIVTEHGPEPGGDIPPDEHHGIEHVDLSTQLGEWQSQYVDPVPGHESEPPVAMAPYGNGTSAHAPVAVEFASEAAPVAEAPAAPPMTPLLETSTGSISLSFSSDQPLEAALEAAADPPPAEVPRAVAEPAPPPPAASQNVPQAAPPSAYSVQSQAPAAEPAPPAVSRERTPDETALEKARAWKDSLTWQEQEALSAAAKNAEGDKEGVVGFLLRTLGVR